jgi:Asp-tRNA(Asn)/Glu-tRNA(Gln) amidotransferase A subunit family amidase
MLSKLTMRATLAEVRGVPFYIPPPICTFAAGTLRPLEIAEPASPPDAQLIPVTLLVALHGLSVGAALEQFLRKDDVINPGFFHHLILSQDVDVSGDSLSTLAKSWNISSIKRILPQDRPLPRSGPYFLSPSTQDLHQAWRLYEDTAATLVCPVHTALDDSNTFYVPLTAGVSVPSRLYFPDPSPEFPLSGLRVVVKDNIDLKGVPTSAGNKAFRELYGQRLETAPCVQRLLDAGAVVVGKAKTVQFASGANARDWIDYQPSFNPRADGYQDPGCSSAGSASAVAAYEWLDISIATDTFGSVIGPAADHGVFGLRPTFGTIPTDGVVPMSKNLDTVGIISRDIGIATAAANVMAGRTRSDTRPAITELVIPSDMFPTDDAVQAIYDRFIEQFCNFLGISTTSVSLNDKFVENKVLGGASLWESLGDTTPQIHLYECFHHLAGFRQEYRERFGKEAFADPYIMYKWGLGEVEAENDYNTALAQKEAVEKWMKQNILPSPSSSSHMSTLDKIVLIPNGRVKPKYRHQYKDNEPFEKGAKNKQGYGYKSTTLFNLAGLPMLNIPVGQVPYHSSVTGRQEWLPTSILLAGPAGSELELMDLVHRFLQHTKEFKDIVDTGAVAYARSPRL